jgi:hypothetical protein
MIALYNFIPLYCPSCDTPTCLDHADNVLRGKYQAHQAISCLICGVMYQLSTNINLLRAATSTGWDMVDYLVEHDEDEGSGTLN